MNQQTKIKTKTSFQNFFHNIRFIIIGLSLSSILAYLLVVNHSNTMGIQLGQMKLKIDQLHDFNRDLENQAFELKSMSRIEAISNVELSMVQAETYDYLRQGSVAVRGQ